jgi:hypothetical protein
MCEAYAECNHTNCCTLSLNVPCSYSQTHTQTHTHTRTHTGLGAHSLLPELAGPFGLGSATAQHLPQSHTASRKERDEPQSDSRRPSGT